MCKFCPQLRSKKKIKLLLTPHRRVTLAPNVNLKSIADRCERFSGADLASLVREASINALARVNPLEDSDDKIPLTAADFELALTKVHPSVSKEDEQKYLKLEFNIRTVK